MTSVSLYWILGALCVFFAIKAAVAEKFLSMVVLNSPDLILNSLNSLAGFSRTISPKDQLVENFQSISIRHGRSAQ